MKLDDFDGINQMQKGDSNFVGSSRIILGCVKYNASEYLSILFKYILIKITKV